MIKQIPRTVAAIFLPGLKEDDLVKTKNQDYSQSKGGFETKPLPAGTVGRVKTIYDMTVRKDGDPRYLLYIKFVGHPIVNLYAEEVDRVKVPVVRGDRRKEGRTSSDRRSRARTPGRFKDAVDAAHNADRKLKK